MTPSPLLAEAWAVVRTARGAEPADLILRRGRLVNVYSGELHPADVVIRGGRIAAIRSAFPGEGRREVDLDQRLVLPGLVASWEDVPGSPAADLRTALEHGVTSIVRDTTRRGPPGPAPSAPLRSWSAPRIGVPPSLAGADVAATSIEDGRALARQGHYVFPVAPPGGNLRPFLAAWTGHPLDLRSLCLGRGGGDQPRAGWEGIQAAVGIGLAPVEACALATLNPAIAFGLDAWIGSVTPGRWADLCLAEEWGQAKPSRVFVGGIEVA